MTYKALRKNVCARSRRQGASEYEIKREIKISPNVPPVYETLARIGATKFGRSGARKARSKTRVHLFIHARAIYRLLAAGFFQASSYIARARDGEGDSLLIFQIK